MRFHGVFPTFANRQCDTSRGTPLLIKDDVPPVKLQTQAARPFFLLQKVAHCHSQLTKCVERCGHVESDTRAIHTVVCHMLYSEPSARIAWLLRCRSTTNQNRNSQHVNISPFSMLRLSRPFSIHTAEVSFHVVSCNEFLTLSLSQHVLLCSPS